MRLSVRTNVDILTSKRLDPYYYQRHFIEHSKQMRSRFKTMKCLASLFTVLDGTHDSVETKDVRDSTFKIPFLRAQDIGVCYLREPGAFLRKLDHENKCKRSRIKVGDILLNIMASTGESCFYSDSCPNEANANRAVGILRSIDQNLTELDRRFIVALLSSKVGGLELSRNLKGSIQQRLNLEDIAESEIPEVDPIVRTYIGDKVRQAERLRERSKSLECNAKLLLDASLNWTKELESKSIYRRVKVAELYHRLDLNFNFPNKLQLFEYLRENKVTLEPLAKLAEISAMIGWKGLTTEHYTNHGPWLLRGVEFSNGLIDFDSLVSIKQHKYDEQPQIHLLEGDIALTKDGTIGRAIVIAKLTNELAAGSTVARLRIYSDCQANAYYLEYVLNHPVVQIQIMSFASGIAQPHITQEWIAKLQIPRCEYEDKIGNFVFEHHQAVTYASYLTTAAKFLVEALIEGDLKESELKAAQEALQQGDNDLDQEILSRLTRKGYNVLGEPPLFPDLDALYEALQEAENSQEVE